MAPTAKSAVGSRPPMTTTSATALIAMVPSTVSTTTTTMTTTTTTTGFTPKHRVLKPKRKRKGWGPYQSIVKERSVAFNLTLDIQNLRQEIQQLLTTRELLQSRSLQLRQAPTGSLMQTVHEFLRLFRQSFPVQELHSRRIVDTSGERRDFLYSVVDPDIDYGHGNRGVEFMVEQFRRYSLLTRFIAMEMTAFDIVELDDDVVLIKATGSWRFQVLRETILGMFPHVAGNEWLLSRLVGQEVIAPTTLLFRFTSDGRICQYEPDANYVTSFSEILTDPDDLAELLSQARIGEHSAIGVAKDGRVEDVEDFINDPPRDRPDDRLQRVQGEHELYREPDFLDFYTDIALRYVAVFSRWWPARFEASHENDALESDPAEFLHRQVSPYVVCCHGSGHEALELQWKALSDSFQVISVQATASPDAWHGDEVGVLVRLHLVYRLRIDGHTIHTVFPHTRQYPSLAGALIGTTIDCPSFVELEWADAEDGCVIACIREHFDWHEALTPLFPRANDLELVLRHALLSPQGVVLPQPMAQQTQHSNHGARPPVSPHSDMRHFTF